MQNSLEGRVFALHTSGHPSGIILHHRVLLRSFLLTVLLFATTLLGLPWLVDITMVVSTSSWR